MRSILSVNLNKKLFFFLFAVLLLVSHGYAASMRASQWRAAGDKYGKLPESIIHPPCLDVSASRGCGSSRPGRFSSNQSSCFSHQRVLEGTIEMYNMDHDPMISDITEELYRSKDSVLVKGGYLKAPLNIYDKNCKISNFGSINEYGIIYCHYHGAVTSPRSLDEVEAAKEELESDLSPQEISRSVAIKEKVPASEKIAAMVMIGLFLAVSFAIFYLTAKVKESHNKKMTGKK